MVTVFLANGFEEMEALAPVDLLRRAGIAVQTAAVSEDGSRWITGSHGITVQCDVAAKEVSEQEMEMLVLPGGLPGTTYLDASPEVDRWLRYASEEGIFVGAICAAPSVLGNRGLLDGRRAVSFPGFEPKGALICQDQGVVRDDQYITAKGAGVCLEFGLELIACLKGPEAAQRIKEGIQCQR